MKRLSPLSEMERIEQTLLVEKLDEILERIDNEDIGFVITENGLPDMSLYHFAGFPRTFQMKCLTAYERPVLTRDRLYR